MMLQSSSFPPQTYTKNTNEKIREQIVRIHEEENIAEARQKAKRIAEQIGFRRSNIYEIATSVSELANNLFFHAYLGGEITLCALKANGYVGMEIMSRDKGPGILDIRAALTDGFSTNGGLGSGLPGVKRLMDDFKIESRLNQGTTIIARKWSSCRSE